MLLFGRLRADSQNNLTNAMISNQLLRRYASIFILSTICLTAFSLIALLSDQIFEHLPHSEDEVAYIFQAKVFAQNRLAAPTPPYRQAFWTPFVVDYQGQRFGKYPPGWPFLLSFGMRLNAPWLVNALLGTFTLALVAWLGHCFYKKDPRFLKETGYLHGSSIGLWAAGLGLVTPGFLFLSSSLLSHSASLFWSTLALVGLFYTSHQQWLYALLTGFALGAAFVTRPFAGVGIGLAVGIWLMVLSFRRDLKGMALPGVVILGGLLIAALAPLYGWAVTGDPFFNAYLLVWPYDRIGFGPDIGPHGYSLADAIFVNTHLKLTALAAGLFGWPGWSSLLFLPIPFLARRANRWDWLLLGSLLSLIFVHIFYWAFGGADGGFPRYYYDALPALLLLTVRGVKISADSLNHWLLLKRPTTEAEAGLREQNPLGWFLARRASPSKRGGFSPAPAALQALANWLPVGLIIIFTGYNLIWNLPPLLAAQKGKYGITAAQLEVVEQANLTTPALVIVKEVKKWNDFAAPFAANSPTLDGPVVFASDEGAQMTQKLRELFKDRTCWELAGKKVKPCSLIDSKR